jgi:hypothetical protein
VDEIPKTVLSEALRKGILSSPEKSKRLSVAEIDVPALPRTLIAKITASSPSSQRSGATRFLLGATAVAAAVTFYALRPRMMGRAWVKINNDWEASVSWSIGLLENLLSYMYIYNIGSNLKHVKGFIYYNTCIFPYIDTYIHLYSIKRET